MSAFPTDWGRRCALVIQSSQVTDNEVNFPLLVAEDTLPSEIFDADGSYPALNGGGDIRFSSDEAGNTQLACEIEKFVTDNNPANGKAAIWVKVPSLSSSSNTTIYIWYNKAGESQPAEDNAYGKENVWDTNFKMVQHMNQTPDGTAGEIVDSTSNNNDGTTYNMDSADQVAGQIDGSLDFDGGDWVDIGTGARPVETITVSAWVKADTLTNHDAIVGDTALSFLWRGWQLEYYASELHFYIDEWNKNYAKKAFTDTSGYHFVVGTYDKNAGSNQINIYIDNVIGTPDTYSTNILYTNCEGFIGKGFNQGSNSWDGIIDEVRISNIARSAGWIATEYNNQNSPGTFVVEGIPESPGAPPTFIPQIIIF